LSTAPPARECSQSDHLRSDSRAGMPSLFHAVILRSAHLHPPPPSPLAPIFPVFVLLLPYKVVQRHSCTSVYTCIWRPRVKTPHHPCLYLFSVGMWRRVSGFLNVAGGGGVVCGSAERLWNSCGTRLQRLGGVALLAQSFPIAVERKETPLRRKKRTHTYQSVGVSLVRIYSMSRVC
jgi:hypothetical protein